MRNICKSIARIKWYWRVPSSTPLSVQHISSTQRATPFQPPKFRSSTPKTPQFNTQNPSVPHQKTLSSTPSVPHQEPLSFWCGTEMFLVLNWGVFGVELRGFLPGNEGFLVWNWGRGGTKGFLVLNWGGLFGTESFMKIT